MKKTLLLMLGICLTLTSLIAEGKDKGLISGKVIDENKQPVAFANVLLRDAIDSVLVKGAITDDNGLFTFDEIAVGKFFITATMVGFADTHSETFEVKEGEWEVNLPTIVLGESSVDLAEVTVKAKKPFIELQSDKIVMNVESSPVATGNTALELLQKAPGVIVDNSNNISLKGRQGVLVMIDGKQTYMSNEEIARLLETTPAASIESIEIINNPSSKYDAAGNAGIINIVMKKDKNLGMNGSLTLGTGYGNLPKANGSLRLNYRQKKFNIFGDYNYWYNNRNASLAINRTIPYNGMETIFDQVNQEESITNSHRFKLGADFFLNEKTTIGVLATGRTGTWEEEGENNTYISGDNPEDFSRLNVTSLHQESWNNYSYNVNLVHKFDKKGRQLTFDADYSEFRQDGDNNYTNLFLNGEAQVNDPSLLNTTRYSGVDILAAKVDYSHPLPGDVSLEMGAKSSMVTTDNNIDFNNHINDAWILDTTRSNQFHYQEDIHAFYINLSKKFEKFTLQAGFRGELTHSKGVSVTLQDSLERAYFSPFPTLSISHQLGEDHSMSYSYSRRIDRPTYQDLNPFVYFLDQYTFGKGNPFLQPQFTHAVSATYGFKNFAFATLSYSRTHDAMTEILEQVDSSRITYQTMTNFAKFDNVSLNLSSPIPIKEWWNARINVSTYYNHFQTDFQDSEVDTKGWATNIYLSNNFTIGDGIRAEVSGFYQSPMVYGIIKMKAQYSVNAGVNMSIMDGKGSLRLNVDDIFNTQRFHGIFQQGTVNVDVLNKWESRRVSVAFTYNFGNQEVKSERRRNTATSDEQRRVKGNN